jgi:hypothetical protein
MSPRNSFSSSIIFAFYILLATIISLCQASSFSRGQLSHIELVRAPSIDTPSRQLSAYSHFDLSFQAFSRRFRLALEPHFDIIPDGATFTVMGADGEVEYSEPIDRLDHRVYKGNVWAQNLDHGESMVGHARMYVHEDGDSPVFEGAFDMHNDYHHILIKDHYMLSRHPEDPVLPETNRQEMVIFRDSDFVSYDGEHYPPGDLRKRFVADDHVACASDQLDFNMDLNHPVYQSMISIEDDEEARYWSTQVSHLFGKRQLDPSTGPGNSAGVNLMSTIGSTAGCFTTRKIALVGVATDCTYTGLFNSSEAVRTNVISIFSSASTLYEKSFNVSLGLQNITILPSDCPGTPSAVTPWNVACSTNVNIQNRLNSFSSWRAKQQDTNSHWTLLTNCNSGSAVGLAWLGQACVISAEAANNTIVAGANVVAKTPTEWQVVAHETGHTFGAVHDCTSTTCSDGTSTKQLCCPLSTTTCDAGQKYIMNPSTAQGITSFSACSVGNICSAIGRASVKTTCFSSNKGVPLITAAQCGNGIVEEGEDCDCGGPTGCVGNKCCNPTTCKFITPAVCDQSNEECCSGCQFMASGAVCRASTGVCDPQEVCSGTNGTCPTDAFAPNGQGCGSGNSCASGHCTSRNLQCQQLMGTYLNGTNDTYACDGTGCVLSCASPEFGPNMCYGLQQNFLDGTPCGGGGACSNVSSPKHLK